jgi:hypothetical protein
VILPKPLLASEILASSGRRQAAPFLSQAGRAFFDYRLLTSS